MQKYTINPEEIKSDFLLPSDLLLKSRHMTMEEKGILLTAIMEYENGIPVDLDILPASVAMAFIFLKDKLDYNRKKYAATCKARSEAGKKSAQARKNAKANADTNNTLHRSEEEITSEEAYGTNSTNVNTCSTNLTDSDSEPEYENDNDDILSLTPSLRKKEKCMSIINLYNQHCPALRPAELSSHTKRVKNVEQVLSVFPQNELIALFKKANSNRFLTGNGPNGWVASFDWLMNIDHLTKLREDVYRASSKTNSPFKSFTQRSYDFETLEKELLSN